MKTYWLAVCGPGMASIDDDHAADHQREADTGLRVVAQVAEQECGCQADDSEAADEWDQQRVDVARATAAISQ